MVAGAPLTEAGGPDGSARLGRYQLIRRLATGGMAELFLARASAMHGFEKLVVLKRILPQHAESEDFIRMFLAEARLAATLHHPNIVQVYDIGEEAGAYFFTMEYVQGQDLRKLVRAARKAQRAIPLEHILHIIMGIAAGLNHAHEKVGLDGRPLGIVHRDVSPSNVLVTYEGDIKIVDFGIAKAATAQVATIAGTLKGKIPYMSPEQCRGESVDRRSDVFSIGTLLWELTTGKRLFAGDNEFAILNRVAKGDVPQPSSIRPDYPPELEAIVMRALQPDPEQRYAEAIDLQLDLEDFAREARLPVSSARMARFMRELFDEEMRAAALEFQNDQTEIAAPMQVPLAPTTNLQPASVTGDAPAEAAEYTPSEVRRGSAPTPGPDADISGSGTDIVMAKVPGRLGLAPVLGIGGGFVATLALITFMAMGVGGEDKDNRPKPPPEVPTIRATPAIEEQGPKPGSSPLVDEPPAPLDPAVEQPPAVDAKAGRGGGKKPSKEKEPKDPAVLERDHGAKRPASTPTPSPVSPQKAKPPKKGGTNRNKGRKSGRPKKSTVTKESPPKKTKHKWNIDDSALPPDQ